MVKKGYYENEGLGLAWDLGIIFLGIPDLWFGGLKNIYFKKNREFEHKGIIEKCVSCFLVYPFYESFFFFYKKVFRDEGFKFFY